MSGLLISCSGTLGQPGGGPEILGQGTAGLGSQPVAGVDAGGMAARQARYRWQRRVGPLTAHLLNVASPVQVAAVVGAEGLPIRLHGSYPWQAAPSAPTPFEAAVSLVAGAHCAKEVEVRGEGPRHARTMRAFMRAEL